MAHDVDLERSATLLAAELRSARYHDPRYLRWLYHENPLGPAIQASVDDDLGRVAHFALVPQDWTGPAGVLRLGISLNAVVRTGAQRSGRFTELARDLFVRASSAGISGTLTVANASSTPPFLRKLGLRMIRPLPVRLIPALGESTGVRSTPINGGSEDAQVVAVVNETGSVAVRRWVQQSTVSHLRWRLANPVGSYVLHESDDILAISTSVRAFGTRVAVLLRFWPRQGRTGLSARRIVSAACRHHRTRFGIYAGFNAHVRVPGIAVPRRLLPSPLNLLAGAFDRRVDVEELVPDTYEFLDTDHF